MSKLTKLLKHPILFFRDSKLFRTVNLSNLRKSKNLFFIAHYGQLEQIQALIRYEQLTDCFICVLYTPANKKMPKLVVDNIDHALIDGYLLTELPIRPNKISISKLIYIKRVYDSIIDNVTPDSIYLLSFEVHYALIADIANRKGINLSLIEEGTATYKFDNNGSNLSPVLKNEDFNPHSLLIRYCPFFSKLKPALDTARDFDHIYAAYPDLLKNAFNYKKLTRFLLHAPGGKSIDSRTIKIVNKYNITPNDIIFVSQRYSVEQDLFFNIIFEFLSELSFLTGSRVFIKLHPKESESSLRIVQDEIARRDAASLFLISDHGFLIEPTIAYAKPKAVVGISSTSLAYTSLVSPQTATISFGSYLVESLKSAGSEKAEEISVIQSHIEILKKFPRVVMANTPNQACEIISGAANEDQLSGELDYDLLAEADSFYSEAKYWKAYCYYLWGFNGIDLEENCLVHYCNFLDCSLHLDVGLFDLNQYFSFINVCYSSDIDINADAKFLKVVAHAIRRAYFQYEFKKIIELYRFLTSRYPAASLDDESVFYFLFALLIERDLDSIKDHLSDFDLSSTDFGCCSLYAYLLFESALIDFVNIDFYYSLALSCSEKGMLCCKWLVSVLKPFSEKGFLDVNDKFAEIDKLSYDCPAFNVAFFVLNRLNGSACFKKAFNDLRYDLCVSTHFEPIYYRELGYCERGKLASKLNDEFLVRSLTTLPASFQPLIILSNCNLNKYIDEKEVRELNYTLFHSSEMSLILSSVVANFYVRGLFCDLITLVEVSHKNLSSLDFTTSFYYSIALRKLGDVSGAWKVVQEIDVDVNSDPAFIKHKAEIAALLRKTEESNDCWNKLAILNPDLVPDFFWFN